MFLFGKKYDDYEPEEDVYASSGMFYQRSVSEFTNIDEFVYKYYPENTILIPLCNNIDVILSDDNYEDKDYIPHDIEITYDLAEGMIEENENLTEEEKDEELKELYRTTYDYRLFNPYILRDSNLLPINVKMLGDKKCRGLIGRFLDILEWIDKQISTIPFGWAKKWIVKLRNKYDKKMVTNKGKVIKTVIWIPLYSISNSAAICVTLIDRIDIIIT